MKKLVYVFALLLIFPGINKAQKDTLHVYGPGGPFAPSDESAKLFGKAHDIFVKVIAGPEDRWIDNAKQNADLIYGGAEYMLTAFSMKNPVLSIMTPELNCIKEVPPFW